MANILIIEDDPDFRRIVAQTLSAAGYQISEAKSGMDGIAAFHARHPALVITKVAMSRNEGMEIIQELRRAASILPILAVSINIDVGLCLKIATVLGVNVAVVKSFDPRELLRAVAKLLSLHGQSAIAMAA